MLIKACGLTSEAARGAAIGAEALMEDRPAAERAPYLQKARSSFANWGFDSVEQPSGYVIHTHAFSFGLDAV